VTGDSRGEKKNSLLCRPEEEEREFLYDKERKKGKVTSKRRGNPFSPFLGRGSLRGLAGAPSGIGREEEESSREWKTSSS